MGFFGKLFEKKSCDLCGGEIGLLGNRKLEDGNCCKNCAGKLSYWFDDRRHSTVEQIRQQLAYRGANQRELAGFRPSKSYGEMYELKVEMNGNIPTRFVVARTDDYQEENADLILFSQVTSFNIDIDEHREELKYRNSEGEMVSYSPKRYEYSYDFFAEIGINSPYFDDIRFRVNRSTLNLETLTTGPRANFGKPLLRMMEFEPMQYAEYRHYKSICDELEELFRCGMQGQPIGGGNAGVPTREQMVQQLMDATMDAMAAVTVGVPAAAAAPAPAAKSVPAVCPNCHAPTDGGKFCEYCGSPL